MERYTYFADGKWRLQIGKMEYCGVIADRLAAFEDLGVEPKQLAELLQNFRVLPVSSSIAPDAKPDETLLPKEEQRNPALVNWHKTLELPARIRNSFEIFHKRVRPLITVQDIADMENSEILALRSVGAVSRRIVAKQLKDLGFDRGDSAWLEFLPKDTALPQRSATRLTKKIVEPKTDPWAKYFDKYLNDPLSQTRRKNLSCEAYSRIGRLLEDLEQRGLLRIDENITEVQANFHANRLEKDIEGILRANLEAVQIRIGTELIRLDTPSPATGGGFKRAPSETIEALLEKYLGDPESKAIWSKWSMNHRFNIGIQLGNLEQEGLLSSEANIEKLKAALAVDNTLWNLREVLFCRD